MLEMLRSLSAVVFECRIPKAFDRMLPVGTKLWER